MSVTKKNSSDEIKANIKKLLKIYGANSNQKYVNLMYNIIKKSTIESQNVNYFFCEINRDWNSMIGKNMSFTEQFELQSIINVIGRVRNFKTFFTFCEYNEKNKIKNNDLSRLKSFDELSEEIIYADNKISFEEIDKQIINIYEDDEWKIIKPLSRAASIKYGKGTKWCVSSVSSDYFIDYATRGLLIFVINKQKTKAKIAIHKNLETLVIGFWNVIDQNIDSRQSNLPLNIINIVFNELKSTIANYDLLDSKYKENNIEKEEYIESVIDNSNNIDETIIEQLNNYIL